MKNKMKNFFHYTVVNFACCVIVYLISTRVLLFSVESQQFLINLEFFGLEVMLFTTSMLGFTPYEEEEEETV